MRKILINAVIEFIAVEYEAKVKACEKYEDSILHPDYFLKRLIKSFDDDDVQEVSDAISRNFITPPDIADFKRYVRAVLWFYNHGLLVAKPSKMVRYKTLFDKIVPPTRLKAKLKVGSKKVHPFNEIIVTCLQYSLIRHNVACNYIKKLGIKACVYCNADFTITEEGGQAFYDIDHWKPQSQYPFLAISFYNMQPSCHTCNVLKNDDDNTEYFGLYEEDPNADLEIFKFNVDLTDIARYLISGKVSAINIKFAAKASKNDQMCAGMDKKLCITKKYAEHRDVAEEIIRKKQYYNNSFLESLKPIFKSGSYIPDDIDVKRYILGFYPDDKNIHKRPLNKMALDIFNG